MAWIGWTKNVNCYRINLRSKKWWWPLFSQAIDICVNNSFALYKLQSRSPGEKKLDLLGFRREIVEAYNGNVSNEHRKNESAPQTPLSHKIMPGAHGSTSPHIRRDGTNHWIVQQSTQRRCKYCFLVGLKDKMSVYTCEKCNVALHPKCFKDFHTM